MLFCGQKKTSLQPKKENFQKEYIIKISSYFLPKRSNIT